MMDPEPSGPVLPSVAAAAPANRNPQPEGAGFVAPLDKQAAIPPAPAAAHHRPRGAQAAVEPIWPQPPQPLPAPRPEQHRRSPIFLLRHHPARARSRYGRAMSFLELGRVLCSPACHRREGVPGGRPTLPYHQRYGHPLEIPKPKSTAFAACQPVRSTAPISKQTFRPGQAQRWKRARRRSRSC